MELLEKRILTDGIVAPGDVLKVDGFLNQRIDVPFVLRLGKEFYNLYRDCGVNKILTIEASGIGIACLTATYFRVPVVFAKKTQTPNITGEVYSAKVHSYTHNCDNAVVVSKKYLTKEDKVLIIDDFLANGSALSAMKELAEAAGAEIVGAGIVIEKEYQGGGRMLRAEGMRIESLAKIASLSIENGIIFCR